MIETPADVVRELAEIRAQSEKGVAYLAEIEEKYVRLDSEANKLELSEFLDAQGTVADRQAIAKLRADDLRFEAELARVEMNRVKNKLKHLSEAQMSVQTQARMVELEWKSR